MKKCLTIIPNNHISWKSFYHTSGDAKASTSDSVTFMSMCNLPKCNMIMLRTNASMETMPQWSRMLRSHHWWLCINDFHAQTIQDASQPCRVVVHQWFPCPNDPGCFAAMIDGRASMISMLKQHDTFLWFSMKLSGNGKHTRWVRDVPKPHWVHGRHWKRTKMASGACPWRSMRLGNHRGVEEYARTHNSYKERV